MASALSLVLFVGVLGLHTAVAAVLTRYFRVVLHTTWGWVVYAAFFVPVVLTLSTLLFTGLLGIGPDLGDATTALAVTVGLPLAVGVTVDLLYVPAPEEVDLPEPGE